MVKVKILIVDDEIDYCSLMQSYFEEKNYDVYTASNLHDAFKLLNDVKPDIVFLDNNLPDGEGWNHTDEILNYVPQAKINLISGYKQPADFKKLNEKIKVWEKPLSFELLNQVF